ncbi:hypothetical protein HMPREF0063_10058 [Aeromicrobium marinum DSM 15272]|uniref:Phage protein Gp19/Gp15/Gp42 n=2 Tax=Aeromicrobium marinum TaxID=219314 RepID=E2S7Q1_9ACTN|nr:hypothetical protein HMPREF0063_10058 [Aeromicrobium marinum DSM 15272]
MFRSLTVEETTVASRLLRVAEADLASKVVALRERFTAAQAALVEDPADETAADFVELATATVCAPVIRVLRNPDGIRQLSIDDGSYTRDQALSSGILRFEPDEVNRLQPSVALGGAYVIGLGG